MSMSSQNCFQVLDQYSQHLFHVPALTNIELQLRFKFQYLILNKSCSLSCVLQTLFLNSSLIQPLTQPNSDLKFECNAVFTSQNLAKSLIGSLRDAMFEWLSTKCFGNQPLTESGFQFPCTHLQRSLSPKPSVDGH